MAMYDHYVDLFRCHSATAGHRLILAYNYLEMAAKLGRYHRAVRWLQPGEELPDWISMPDIPAGDMQLNYVDAFTLLGDALHLAYGHPMTLARAYDHMYHEGQEMGNLPLQGKKNAEQSMAIYWEEYAQVTHHFYTLARIGCEKFVRPMPTSLAHPDWVPGQIPPKIRSPEYGGNSSDASSDTQASHIIQAVSVTTGSDQPDYMAVSTSAGCNTRKVELKPLPGLTQQFATHLEWEIQKQVEEQSHKIVQEVLQRSANHIMPPTLSEAARATLSKCFQKAWTGSQPAPSPSKPAKAVQPPEQPEEWEHEEEAQYSLADPIAGINPVPRQLDQPQ